MRVLVTGCGGFLGSHVVKRLLDRGDDVVGISRGRYPDLEAKGMSHRQGDLTDADWSRQAVSDVDAVIHTAAIAGVWGDRQTFEKINISATRHVVDACRKNDIGTLVHTSSPSVTFDGNNQSGVDESEPYPKRWLCDYPRTKAIAEQIVLDAHEPERLVACALRPHLIWGDGDPHLLPRVIRRAAAGRLRIVGTGDNRVDMVHVDNAAEAHLCALDSLRRAPEQAGGRVYFIGQDEPVHCWEWLARFCDAAGVPPPSRRVPLSVAYMIGGVLESVYRGLRRDSEPLMTRFVALQLARDHYFDITAARERLGYAPKVTMEDGFRRTEPYLRQLGQHVAS